MPIYRVTFKFSGGGEGWSETHLYQNTNTDFNAIRPLMNQVAVARAQMLGDPFYVWAIRIAKYLKDDGTRDRRGVRLWKGDPAAGWAGWYNLQFGAKNNGSEPSQVACQAIGYAGANGPALFQGNQNQTFLGGVPDEVVDNNGNVYPAKLGFGANFNVWAGILTKPNSGWGWGAATQLADLPIQTIAQNPNGTVLLTVNGAVPGGVVLNNKYPARVRDVNQGRSALNGEVLVTRTGDQTFVTREVIGIPTSQSNGFHKVYAQVPTFVPYNSIELALVAVKHKRGKSPAARPGRVARRIRG